jgi:membrane-associated PAP2 superfamily phosphatase
MVAPARPVSPLWPTVALTAALVAWDLSGADLWLAGLSGTPFGFPLRADWALNRLMHNGGKTLSWALTLAMLVAVWMPVGHWRRLVRAERWQLVLSVLAAVGVVTLVKKFSLTSCPWDLRAFGGVAEHVSHWRWRASDGGPGHCFPAGHASAAFGFVGGWFVWRRHSTVFARGWLLAALAAGLAFGVGQQLRGAHFLSHTLWSGWLCWMAGWAVDGAMAGLRRPVMSGKLNNA